MQQILCVGHLISILGKLSIIDHGGSSTYYVRRTCATALELSNLNYT